MLTPPHVYDWSSTANPEFAIQYFHDVANAVEIPITIFHYPASTASGYLPDTAIRIAREVDSVVAAAHFSQDTRQLFTVHCNVIGPLDSWRNWKKGPQRIG